MLASVLHARVAAALAAAALLLAIAGAWPGLRMPAWPGAVLGLAAIAMGLRQGPVLARAVATVGGAAAALVAGLQIAVLWGVAVALP